MFGLGKRRSKFGKWIDRKGIKQEDIRKIAKIGNGTISDMCNKDDYSPRISTWVKVQRALRSMGHNVDRDDFFDI
jgi:predicted transcriptional regulator